MEYLFRLFAFRWLFPRMRYQEWRCRTFDFLLALAQDRIQGLNCTK